MHKCINTHFAKSCVGEGLDWRIRLGKKLKLDLVVKAS